MNKKIILLVTSLLLSLVLLYLTFMSTGCLESLPPICKFLGLVVPREYANLFYDNHNVFIILQLLISFTPMALYFLISKKNR
nr:hypothetical protein [uncultured archaeon]AQS34290.1 hypothetical protein [uncultured archaeon]AQS34741.1 hypothetical protein [uncultured archaeon]